MPKPNNTDAFLAAKAEIDHMLERLTALSGTNFGVEVLVATDDDVATLRFYERFLSQMTDALIHDGLPAMVAGRPRDAALRAMKSVR
jgi:hypothetical protein